jgi:predicted GIY-YIG superfamily endonuclease
MKKPVKLYLLCYDMPHPHGTSRHYLGSAKDLDTRIAQHRSGRGAAFTAEMKRLGIPFDVVRVWDGTRDDERAMKLSHHHDRYCPRCAQAARERFNAYRRAWRARRKAEQMSLNAANN